VKVTEIPLHSQYCGLKLMEKSAVSAEVEVVIAKGTSKVVVLVTVTVTGSLLVVGLVIPVVMLVRVKLAEDVTAVLVATLVFEVNDVDDVVGPKLVEAHVLE